MRDDEITWFFLCIFALAAIIVITARSWGRSYEAREFRRTLRRALYYRSRPTPKPLLYFFLAIVAVAWGLMFLLMAGYF